MKWVDDEGVMDMSDDKLDTYLRNKAQSLMAMPISTNGGSLDLYTQLKTQTENAGMEVEEIEGKVVVTGSPE
jgi:hypothetical protein